MVYDRYFGFDLIQRKTLQKLLEEMGGVDVAALQAQIAALTARVAALEDA